MASYPLPMVWRRSCGVVASLVVDAARVSRRDRRPRCHSARALCGRDLRRARCLVPAVLAITGNTSSARGSRWLPSASVARYPMRRGTTAGTTTSPIPSGTRTARRARVTSARTYRVGGASEAPRRRRPKATAPMRGDVRHVCCGGVRRQCGRRACLARARAAGHTSLTSTVLRCIRSRRRELLHLMDAIQRARFRPRLRHRRRGDRARGNTFRPIPCYGVWRITAVRDRLPSDVAHRLQGAASRLGQRRPHRAQCARSG